MNRSGLVSGITHRTQYLIALIAVARFARLSIVRRPGPPSPSRRGTRSPFGYAGAGFLRFESPRAGRAGARPRIRLAEQYAVLRAPVHPIDVAEPDRPDAPTTRALHDHELVAVVTRLHLGQPPEVLFHGRRPCAEELRLHLRIGTHADDVGRICSAHSSQQHALALDHFKSSSRISDSTPIGRTAVRPMTRSSASGGSPKPSLP